MANSLYAKAKEAFLSGAINLLSDDIRAILVDTGAYTVNISSHQFLSDIPSGARIATSTSLANKVVTGGVFDADDISISAVSGASVEAVVLYKHTGADSTARLILYDDTASAGLPFTPSGGPVTVSWDNGSNKIFAL